MSQQPVVSVIIPTYNRADILPRAINSVLQQTYADLECIVVDDASTDNTALVVQQLKDNRLVYRRHEMNCHVSAARNTGIAFANGEFIAFLDDDDEWLPTKLEEQISLIKNLPTKIGFVYCWMDYYNQDKLIHERHPDHRGFVFPLVLDRQRLGNCSTLLVRRSVVKEVGGFDEALPRGNDGDFIRRICLNYEVDYIAKVLVKYYIDHGHDRITSSNEQGIRNALKGNLVKLEKFEENLSDYPRQTASIYATIAYHYSELGDWQNSVFYIDRAFKTCPYNLSVYRNVLLCIRNLILRRSL